MENNVLFQTISDACDRGIIQSEQLIKLAIKMQGKQVNAMTNMVDELCQTSKQPNPKCKVVKFIPKY